MKRELCHNYTATSMDCVADRVTTLNINSKDGCEFDFSSSEEVIKNVFLTTYELIFKKLMC